MVYPPTDGHPSKYKGAAVHGRESNSQPVDHKSNTLTTTPPSHPFLMFMLLYSVYKKCIYEAVTIAMVWCTELHDAIFVVGALDEMMILRGMRYHPIDIENSIVRSHRHICEWLECGEIRGD